MTNAPKLTDQAALTRNRTRALRDPAMFLQETAVEEFQDRLSLVNKTFQSPVIVTGFPEFWSAAFPDAKIVADTDVLNLDPHAHDLVVHAMSMHWANDPVGQMIQCRRALQPDGLFLAAMFGGQTLQELRVSLAEAESRVSGGLSPRVAPMAEIRDLGGLLQRAGFALPVADSIPLTVSYQSALHLMRDLRAMGESNALDARLRRPTRRSVLNAATEIYAQTYGDDQNRVIATFELIFLLGWAPDESQPQPLRPGSATARLADVLGTQETKLSD